MSFDLAKKCFAENRDLVGEPMSDPQNFNLNEGLLCLTHEVEAELSKINRKLDAIILALQRR